MKAAHKVIYLVLILIVLLGCYIHYPNATPQPISPAALTAAPANSETEIADAKRGADRLIDACLAVNGDVSELYTPERLKRQRALVIARPFCSFEDKGTNFTLSDQYPYGQAVYFLYDYNYKNPGASTNEKHKYCLEMMKSQEGKWLANRELVYQNLDDKGLPIEDCFLSINKEK
jgi:hypothetical protein